MKTNKRHANKKGDHVKYVLELPASDKLVAKVKELSDFVQSLNLPLEQNDRLVELVLAQMRAIQTEAFSEGFKLGCEHAEWEARERED